jgi:hypothetical protein
MQKLLNPKYGFLYEANNGSLDIYVELIKIKKMNNKRSKTV